MSGRGNEENNEGVTRRWTLAALLGGIGVSGGAALWAGNELVEDWEKSEDYSETDYRPTETYDMPDDGVDYTTTPGGETDPIDTWKEALPGECSLSADERHWLVAQIDSYDKMRGEDFFDYVEDGRVDLRDDGTELRMIVDENSDGRYDQGYNIPDTC